jgi:hypothetical protein
MLWAAIILADVGRVEHSYRCDVIELNHVHDPHDECHRFTQVIVWNWKPEVNRYHVEAWWIVDTSQLSQLPTRGNNIYRVRRQDGLIVSSQSYQETHSGYDRETADRLKWHESRRVRIEFSR